MPTEPRRGHVLAIEPDTAYAERFPDAPVEYRWSIECLSPEKCGGWQECDEPHEVDGRTAADGPWEADEGDPWAEKDEFDFHGITHEWRYGYGWTVPFEGCVVAEHAGVWCDLPEGLPSPLRPGRWLVDDEWDDTSLTLDVVSEIGGE